MGGEDFVASRAAELVEKKDLDPHDRAAALTAVEKVATDEDLAPHELGALEAIVLPMFRPAVFVQGDDYGSAGEPWEVLDSAATHERLKPVLQAIGRVEIPNHLSLPYAGTGFLVGHDLLMTNRHVAELFATGIGRRGLLFRPGQTAGLDFKRERGSQDRAYLEVTDVALIHPYWDMALLRFRGELPGSRRPLSLDPSDSVATAGRLVVAVGYPAQDPRNDQQLQQRIFEGVYQVKRLQPGKVMGLGDVASYGHPVQALKHDASTLGGNSGSAVVDLVTGRVLGLHFSGTYLDANYAVPAAALARDARVVDTGVQFEPTRAPSTTTDWDSYWTDVETVSPEPATTAAVADPPLPPAPVAPIRAPDPGATGSASFTIPLEVTVSIGRPRLGR